MASRAAPEGLPSHESASPVSSLPRPHFLGGLGGAAPITFGPAEVTCAGWFHPSRSHGRNAGVVVCRPIGYEGNCAHETCREMAEYLARAGFAVVRFDYHGTGNSPGDDTDPDRVQAWLDSLRYAVAEVRRLGGVSQISLVGIRLGATLATEFAAKHGGVENMVLWAPCASGRAFARELRVSAVGRHRIAAAPGAGDVETMGFLYTASTLADLDVLDPSRFDSAPAKRALIIGRDDLAGQGPLPGVLRKLGVDTTHRELPGYAAMMTEPREGDVARGTIEAITEWLSQSHPPASATKIEPAPPAATERSPVVVAGIRELPLVFGPNRRLFGVMSEPAESIASSPRGRVCVLMLSVGTVHHVGPHRMYVKMARALAARGYRALRFDLSGIGDSRSEQNHEGPRMYSKAAVEDVRNAMDLMSARGCDRFVLVGLCSGAYVAFQTALVDERVSGQVLLNPRRLTWRAGDSLRSVMARSYKSTVFYRRALFDPSTYARLLRGEVDVRGIANRIRLLTSARVHRIFHRVLGRPPHHEDVLLNLRRLCARGTDALFIVGDEDDCLDYLEFHLGPKGRDMSDYGNFRMTFVEQTDHTFTQSQSLEKATMELVDYMDHRYAAPRARHGPTLVPVE